MPLWHRLVVVGAVLLVTALVARLLDARIARRQLDPAQRTRYRVLRRSVATTVVVVGVLSARLVIPQERLASEPIRNATIRARQALAEVSVQVPLAQDLGRVVDLLREASPDGEVLVTGIEGNATVTVREWTPDAASADRVASDLRLRAHERLRAAGAYA